MQTAVQQLIELLAHNNILDHKALSSNKRLYDLYLRLKAQAEAKEKQQIIDAGNSCAMKAILRRDEIDKISTLDEINDFIEKDNSITHGEEHYNETYEK